MSCRYLLWVGAVGCTLVACCSNLAAELADWDVSFSDDHTVQWDYTVTPLTGAQVGEGLMVWGPRRLEFAKGAAFYSPTHKSGWTNLFPQGVGRDASPPPANFIRFRLGDYTFPYNGNSVLASFWWWTTETLGAPHQEGSRLVGEIPNFEHQHRVVWKGLSDTGWVQSAEPMLTYGFRAIYLTAFGVWVGFPAIDGIPPYLVKLAKALTINYLVGQLPDPGVEGLEFGIDCFIDWRRLTNRYGFTCMHEHEGVKYSWTSGELLYFSSLKYERLRLTGRVLQGQELLPELVQFRHAVEESGVWGDVRAFPRDPLGMPFDDSTGEWAVVPELPFPSGTWNDRDYWKLELAHHWADHSRGSRIYIELPYGTYGLYPVYEGVTLYDSYGPFN